MRQALIDDFYNGPEYLAKLKRRVKNMQDLEKDEFLRTQRILDLYSVDPIAFFEDCLMLKFSENSGSIKPFFLFEYQKKILRKLVDYEYQKIDVDFLIDKPRGMGLTWLLAGFILWRWLFTQNYSALILSRKEDLVDDGTDLPDETIFGKIRFMLKRIPKWMVPEGFQPKKARGTVTDMNLKIINPAIGSSITGSSTNSNAGRSGRFSMIMIDECFFIERFQEVYNSLTSVARLKVFISTTVESSVARKFKEMCESKGTYHSLTWRDHPFKDQQWYDELVEKAQLMGNPDLMREAQVDYNVSSARQYYPQISQSKVAEVVYDRSRPLYCGLDMGGRQDLTVIIWFQFDGQYIKVLDAYWNTNKPTSWYAPFLNPHVDFDEKEILRANYTEAQHKFLQKVKTWNKPIGVFGEHDHLVKRRPDNKSDQDALAPYKIRIIVNNYAIEYKPRREAVIAILPRTIFNSENENVLSIYDAIAGSRYQKEGLGTTDNLKPVHDAEIADKRAAFENFAANFPRIIKNQRSDSTANDETRSFARGVLKVIRS